jgi:glycine hydroxymethyltransferase
MKTIAELIYLTATDYERKADWIREAVNDLCARFPLYD